ncbi:MAG: hypothetical protein GC178_09055 [Flavobacteriales bacterium]|nr:hypothetical protein [Flavobacteriales bacterium]
MLLLSANLFGQAANDTLNRVDDRGKKQGYWAEYLSEDLSPVKKVEDAKYVHFVSYEDGIRLQKKIDNRNFSRLVPKDTNQLKEMATPIELNGVYTFFLSTRDHLPIIGREWLFQRNKKYDWAYKQLEFKKGKLQRVTLHYRNGNPSIVIDYTDKCGSDPNSYVIKEFSYQSQVETKTYYGLVDQKWEMFTAGECKLQKAK